MSMTGTRGGKVTSIQVAHHPKAVSARAWPVYPASICPQRLLHSRHEGPNHGNRQPLTSESLSVTHLPFTIQAEKTLTLNSAHCQGPKEAQGGGAGERSCRLLFSASRGSLPRCPHPTPHATVSFHSPSPLPAFCNLPPASGVDFSEMPLTSFLFCLSATTLSQKTQLSSGCVSAQSSWGSPSFQDFLNLGPPVVTMFCFPGPLPCRNPAAVVFAQPMCGPECRPPRGHLFTLPTSCRFVHTGQAEDLRGQEGQLEVCQLPSSALSWVPLPHTDPMAWKRSSVAPPQAPGCLSPQLPRTLSPRWKLVCPPVERLSWCPEPGGEKMTLLTFTPLLLLRKDSQSLSS